MAWQQLHSLTSQFFHGFVMDIESFINFWAGFQSTEKRAWPLRQTSSSFGTCLPTQYVRPFFQNQVQISKSQASLRATNSWVFLPHFIWHATGRYHRIREVQFCPEAGWKADWWRNEAGLRSGDLYFQETPGYAMKPVAKSRQIWWYQDK